MLKKIPSSYLWVALILVIAVITRFYQLGNIPHGMTWDEAAIGYNGHAVLTTRRDEWLKKLPISFRSFGDYKAPLAIYLNGFFTLLFGNTVFAVRLPFALIGLLAIAGLYLVSYESLLRSTSATTASQKIIRISVISIALLAISPWHIHFSRVGFESGIALGLLLCGVGLMLRGLRLEKFLPLFLGISCAAASLYAYHSTKIALPFLMLLLLWFVGWKNIFKKKYFWLFVWGGITLLPLIYDLIWGQGLTRASTLIFNKGFPISIVLATIWQNWLNQLSMNFLFFGWTDTLRHGTGRFGVLYLIDLIPLIWLMVRMLTHRVKSNFLTQPKMISAIIFWTSWLVIGLLPAVLGDITPHPNRSLLALPGFLMLIVIGWDDLLDTLSLKKAWYLIGIIYVLLTANFLRYYFTTYAKNSAADFFDGYVEAATIANQIEKNGWENSKPEKILFTSDYGQPYIFVLFVKNLNPIWYQGGELSKYEFTDKINTGDLIRPNTLIVASEMDDIPLEWANYVVHRSDGEVAFKIYYPKAKP